MTIEQSSADVVRAIARQEYDRTADGAEPFDALWERTAAQAASLADRREVLCSNSSVMTEEELRRWWRAHVRMANALAMQKRVRALLDRSQTELKMLYLDAHEARGVDDQLPMTLDPVTGRIVEGLPPRAEPAAPPVPRPPGRPARDLPPSPTQGTA